MVTLTQWNVNVIILSCVSLTIIGYILCFTIKKLYSSQINESINKPIKISAILQMVSYIISFILTFPMMIASLSRDSLLYRILFTFFVICFSIGITSSYLFLCYRLYYTFQDSLFKTSTKNNRFVTIFSQIFTPIMFFLFYSRYLILLSIIGFIGFILLLSGYY